MVVTAPGPMITAQSQLGEVTAQSRWGHSSVTARSQLSHGEVTAQSRHLQYDHGSVTARSQLNQGPGHGSVTAGCDHFGHGELTMSSHGGQFFSHGLWVTRKMIRMLTVTRQKYWEYFQLKGNPLVPKNNSFEALYNLPLACTVRYCPKFCRVWASSVWPQYVQKWPASLSQYLNYYFVGSVQFIYSRFWPDCFQG